MSCAPCQAAAAAALAANNPNYTNLQSAAALVECGFTKDLLQAWQRAMKCIKNTNQHEAIGVHASQTNQILGLLQSALNYPDNYCYYYEPLQYFYAVVLPQIVTNVPSCFD